MFINKVISGWRDYAEDVSTSGWRDYVRSRGAPPFLDEQDELLRRWESGFLPTPTKVMEKPTTPPVKPKPITKPQDTIPNFDKYWLLAKELGITTGKVVQRAVVDFIWENDIEMYDYVEVKAFLGKIAEKEGKKFIWRPLRGKDRTARYTFGSSRDHGYYNPNEWACRPYDKAVPFEILKNVKLIDDQFPDTLQFFVSDYAVVDPDPFIMCTTLDMDLIVFGVWDEPQFFTTK